MCVDSGALEPGRQVSLTRQVTDEDIEVFADLSMDRNRIHFDGEFAARTVFGKKIAHGMISAALISGALTELMGDGNVWLSMSLDFKKPVHVGEVVTCTLTIREVARRTIASISVEVLNSASEPVIVGTVTSMRSSARG